MAEENGWLVTSAAGTGQTYVEIYKFSRFRGSPFRRYTVHLRIVQGAPAAAVESVRFAVSAVKAYALLANTLLTVLLVMLMIVMTPIVAVGRWLSRRRS